MKELLYALPAGAKNAGARWGLTPAHMAYRILPGPELAVVGPTEGLRGGAMYIALPDGPGTGDPAPCCRRIRAACQRRGFRRVICDVECPARAVPDELCAALGRACAEMGLPLCLPERLAPRVPGCEVLVSSVVTAGTLAQRLKEAGERYGPERVVLAVDAAAVDYPLPAAGGGTALAPERLRELMARLEPAVFFDRGLCAHYFTYMVRGGRAHLVLFDTARSVREKLDTAQRLGVTAALLAAPQVEGWLEEIFAPEGRRP